MEAELRAHKGTLAVNVGLSVNILLAAIKTSIGIIGHSPALLADGINSTSDVVYYLVVAVFMRLARKPADEEHPYGHSQLESIAALMVGSFVITTAVAIFWGAINSIFDQVTGQAISAGPASIALWVALITIAIKVFLTFFTRRLGIETNNAAVLALAYDHRNDVFSASGAALGIFLGRIGYPWVDPLAGALVAILVFRTGISILRDSASELMDTVPGRKLESQIREILLSVPGIEQVESVHAHRFGPYLVVNLTICIDGGLTVEDGDRIATQAEETLYRNVEFLKAAHVHYHPAC